MPGFEKHPGKSTPASTDNDFVGYEVLVDFMEKRGLHKLEGDILEIGAFMGGGTAKLARFAQKYGKTLYVIDIFDPERDQTTDKHGVKMSDIYQAFLQGRSQLEVYQQAIREFGNIATINMDSRYISFHKLVKFVFGFIDGNHHPAYVRNDFNLVWNNLVPGGSIAFHDYGFDLPEVTDAIDKLISEHRDEISDIYEIKEKYIIIATKKQGPRC